MINRVALLVEHYKDEFTELNQYIYDNPELGYKEYKSCAAHISLLKKHKFEVKENFLEITTAFRAEYDSGKSGPTVAFLSEYDALPDIGHGCGHNLLGTVSTGAGIILSKILPEIGGKVVVFGTPAEETDGSKAYFTKMGVFNDIDVVLISHPANDHYKSGKSLALDALKFTFKGKSAHAAASPHEGINALDAVINTFNSINALREHIEPSARIHGIISNGGKSPNVVPELAEAKFYVRTINRKQLNILVQKVKNCALGASLAAGTQLEISSFENSFDNIITNETLSNIYCKRASNVGIEAIKKPKESYGSIDTGNVSYVCPTIHPWFSIGDKSLFSHTREFAQATVEKPAIKNMLKIISTLVLTGYDVITDKVLYKEIFKEHKINIQSNK